jgi:L-glyceraldehyde reductase
LGCVPGLLRDSKIDWLSDRIVKNFEQITLNKEDYEKISEIGKNNHLRFNIPITYSPKWSINLFDEEVETEGRTDYRVKLE